MSKPVTTAGRLVAIARAIDKVECTLDDLRDDRNDLVVELRHDGYTVTAIADLAGVSHVTVMSILKRAGVK